VQVAVFAPSTVLAVMMAVPAPADHTVPSPLTVATNVSLLDQFTALLLAVAGEMVAVKV
jgi:hypothetical protein